jgi:hypothetical protein
MTLDGMLLEASGILTMAAGGVQQFTVLDYCAAFTINVIRVLNVKLRT